MSFSWQVISIGGVVLSTLLSGLLLSWIVWNSVMQRMGYQDVLKKISVFPLLVIGVICARFSYVVINLPHYQQQPADILNIRDGGFHIWAGLIGVLIWVFWRHRGIPLKLLLTLVAVTGITASIIELGRAHSRPLNDLKTIQIIQNEQSYNLSSLIEEANRQGKTVVVNVWATWCPPCRREMPVFARLQQSRSDVVILLINQQENQQKINDFLNQSGLTLENIYRDPHGALMQTAGLLGMPATLFFNTNGEWVRTHMGELSEASIYATLTSITTGEK